MTSRVGLVGTVRGFVAQAVKVSVKKAHRITFEFIALCLPGPLSSFFDGLFEKADDHLQQA